MGLCLNRSDFEQEGLGTPIIGPTLPHRDAGISLGVLGPLGKMLAELTGHMACSRTSISDFVQPFTHSLVPQTYVRILGVRSALALVFRTIRP